MLPISQFLNRKLFFNTIDRVLYTLYKDKLVENVLAKRADRKCTHKNGGEKLPFTC